MRPDGSPGIYGVVDMKKAAGVLAVHDDQKVVLVGQYRYTTQCYSWEIIAGGTEDSEEPLTAARRELREEAGLIASDWTTLGSEIHLSNCVTSERAYLFLARGLSRTESAPEPTEILRIAEVPLAQAMEMIGRGEIWDAMTIIALQTYAQHNSRA